MPSLQTHLSTLFAQAFQECGLPAEFGVVVESERPDLGQFQCNGALAAAKSVGQPPRAIAEAVTQHLFATHATTFQELSIAGPGFINITLTDRFLAEHASAQFRDERLGVELDPHPRKTVIDYGGPNVAKPLHVGHLRAGIVGESLKRLHRYMGNEIYGDIHLGDWGTPMGMLLAELAEEQPHLPYFDIESSGPYPSEPPLTLVDLERLYPQAAAHFKADDTFRAAAQQATYELQNGRPGYRALWQHFVDISLVAIKENYRRLNVSFEWWYGESHYHERITPMIDRLKTAKQAIESEGALVIPLPDMPPLILVKSDGAILYATTDLAAVEERVQQDHATRLLYVVDQRQSLHFNQVFAAARQTGIAAEAIELQHLGFGTVNGPDGKPFKTRAGGVMQLKDLIELVTTKARERMQEAGLAATYPAEEQAAIAEQVGIAALKFADLQNNRISDYSFDVDRFVNFEGKTGPYLVYTLVRIKSIFRKMAISEDAANHPIQPPSPPERPLILALSALPVAVQHAYAMNTPHTLCESAFRIAQEFNRFYQQCHIMSETDKNTQASWLSLTRATGQALELLLTLLGIAAPERM